MNPEWIIDARKGNREAFNRLVDLFHKDIFKMVFYRVRSKMDAEDLTQDVFTLAFRHIRQLQDERRFKSWLYSIAVNRVRDHFRNKKVRSWLGFFSEKEKPEEDLAPEFRDPENGALEEMIRQDFWKQLESAMKELSKMEKEVFMLRFLDDLGIREISVTLHKSESTVKTHLYRALAKLQNSVLLKSMVGKERL